MEIYEFRNNNKFNLPTTLLMSKVTQANIYKIYVFLRISGLKN